MFSACTVPGAQKHFLLADGCRDMQEVPGFHKTMSLKRYCKATHAYYIVFGKVHTISK